MYMGAASGAGTSPASTNWLPLRRDSGNVCLVLKQGIPQDADAAHDPVMADSLSLSREHRCPVPSLALDHRLPSYSNPGNIIAALQSRRALSWEVLPATGTGSSLLVN